MRLWGFRVIVAGLLISQTAPSRAQFGRPRPEVPAEPEIRRAQPVHPPRAIPVEAPRARPVTPSFPDAFRRIDELKGQDQLLRPRVQNLRFVDACSARFGPQSSFADAIRLGVEQGLVSRRFPFNRIVREAMFLPENEFQTPVSLVSHPFCPVTKESLDHMLGADKNGVPHTPQPHVIEKIARYVRTLEAIRARAARGDAEARRDFVNAFSTLMGCLAYAESLTTPGDAGDPQRKATFDQRFSEYVSSTPSLRAAFGIREGAARPVRPEGVIFSRDRNGAYFTLLNKIAIDGELTDSDKSSMSEALSGSGHGELAARLVKASKLSEWSPADKDKLKQALGRHFEEWLSVGLYQFMPSATGNVIPCVDSWNESYPWGGCQIKKTEADIARALLSSGQGFNAFCGTQKIVHSISTQVNTSSWLGTDIRNQRGASLAPPRERCVTLYGRGGRGRTYAHFGPLRNSVMNRYTPEGERILDNMEALFSCVDLTFPPAFRLAYPSP